MLAKTMHADRAYMCNFSPFGEKSTLLGDALSSSATVRRGRRPGEVREGATVAIKYTGDPRYLPSRNPAVYQELGGLFCFQEKNVI